MKKIVLSLAVVAMVSCNNTNQQNANTTTTTTEPIAVDTQKESFGFDYEVQEGSVVEWVGEKPTGKHNGTVAVTQGGVNVENGAVVSGEFVLDMNTIVVLDLPAGDGKEDLEDHLKGTSKEDHADHFFNVKKFPTATFIFKSFDGTNLTGDLTIKETTKSVSFPATINIADNEVVIESKPFKINRVEFGVNYASKSVFENLKDKFIYDEIELAVKTKLKK